ncbi:MAG: hypothetical protein QM699_05335 [Amaricoccus sp.]|uniref:hypothetical protein n=1 Tax=Amaricoccus sp. TaxID=1872485 RepID=UPI0039E4B2A1
MKNPWMSMWLSAANKAAGPARSFWSAEAARQQKAFAKAMTEAMFPKLPAAKSSSRSRRSK